MLLDVFLLQAPAPDTISALFPLLFAVVIIFFFALPNYLRQRKHKEFLAGLGSGKTVYTNAGIIGKIVTIDEREATLLIDEKSKIRVLRSTIGGLYEKKGDA
jgi:preprotein translocase YajC subunit